jgi:damage-control phosphatase, subfamily II, stand-alone protein
MEPFCKLADPRPYIAAEWDLLADAKARAAWLRTFDEHTNSLVRHSRGSLYPPGDAALAAYAAAFRGLLERIAAAPAEYAPLNIYSLCALRAEMMREHGIGDPYDRVKLDENVNALGILPKVLRAVDACALDRLVEMLVRGALAGNKFDLGAKDTTELFEAGGIDFASTLEDLPPRPWFVDNVTALAARLAPGAVRYRKAIIFVDNAGGDVVLGTLPLARYLANEGCSVVLAANDEPSLNDVTVRELRELLAHAGKADAALGAHVAAGRIGMTGTGCDCPLIDLGAVSAECNAAARDCDLVILEGMGRAVETNYSAVLNCDAVRIAMIKNRDLAAHLGCDLYGLIVGFTPAGEKPAHA